ncbi:MAG: DUF5685 family protein [Christensenellales bacterium]
MFGYVQPLKCELKIKEYDTFRAYYCGLCKALQKYGKKAQFFVNYDCTFLGLLLDSLAEDDPAVSKRRCAYNPFSKKRIIYENPALGYAADIAVLLGYYKLKDNYLDREFSGICTPLFYRAFKKASKNLPRQAKVIRECLEELRQLEKENCADMDKVAHTSARMVQTIFSLGDEKNSDSLSKIGYNLGRWIYLMDALDDAPKDAKKKRYNVLYKDGKMDIDRERLQFAMDYSLAKAAEGFEELVLNRNRELLKNIIYTGVLHQSGRLAQRRWEDESVPSTGDQ